MQLLVNGNDFTAALLDAPALKIVRQLNKPSSCSFALASTQSGADVPARNDFVAVVADNGLTLFTGYVVTDPFCELAGAVTGGYAYVAHVAATSEEYVLDSQRLPTLQGGVNQGAGTMLGSITGRLEVRGLNVSGLSGGPTVAAYQPGWGQAWSDHAGALSAASRQAYRALDGAVTMTPAGSVVHAIPSDVVEVSGLRCSNARPLANDVTLTGETEADCYVTEVFQGDGVTKEFDLSREPMKVSPAQIVEEGFTGGAVSLQVWSVADPGSRFSLGAAGLQIAGGTGSDGQTTLALLDPVELGGALAFEAGGVMFAAGSEGGVCGLYSGPVNLGGCVAGFRVRSSDGALLLAAVVDGSEVATPFTMTANHAYTLRLRVWMPEVVRALATYYSVGADGLLARGGGLVNSAAWVTFELQDSAAAANTPATVLYDGELAVMPASATFAAVDSLSLVGSLGYCNAQRDGTVRVSSVPAGGTERTRRGGLASQGAEFHVSGERVLFYTAATPAAGELVKVRYRTSQRSVARLAQNSGASANATGVPGVTQWAGSVHKPAARCQADCEAAAQAVLDFSTNALAAWSGSVTAMDLQNLSSGDVWPGDALTLTAPTVAAAANQPSALVVRGVEVTRLSAAGEHLRYSVAVANDWSDALSVELEDSVAQDALAPQVALSQTNQVAANLPALDVTAINSATVTLATNATAPAGGGFEIRNVDANFGASTNGLVVRTPVASITLPRSADHEEFFVRMYDGSTPALYSRYSAAVITNVAQ